VKWRALVAVVIIGFLLPLSSAEIAPLTVDRVCGELGAGEGSTPRIDDITLIPHARIRIYTRTDSANCCASLSPVAETVTGRSGGFRFKKIRPGDYWIVAEIDGAEYKLAVRYRPDKETGSDCSQHLYVLRAGELHVETYVTVTVSRGQ
jgi:hypothetical protein